MALLAVPALLAAPDQAAAFIVQKDCCDMTMEYECYRHPPGGLRKTCGTSLKGKSCTIPKNGLCSARLGAEQCGDICRVKSVCNSTFPDCCQGQCGVSYSFSCGSFPSIAECDHDDNY
jgi:hypothetical protein